MKQKKESKPNIGTWKCYGAVGMSSVPLSDNILHIHREAAVAMWSPLVKHGHLELVAPNHAHPAF